MWLRLEGVVGSGVDVLDAGVRDLVVHHAGGMTHLYATTGRNGGITGYQLDAQGAAQIHTTVIFPPELTGAASDRLVIGDSGAGPVLYFGSGPGGLFGHGIEGDGTLNGTRQLRWSEAEHSAANGGSGIMEAWIAHSDTPMGLFPEGYLQDPIVTLCLLGTGESTFVILACTSTQGIACLLRDPVTGELSATDRIGMADGLGVHAPTAMELVTVGGAHFAVLAAAGTSSLTVMRIGADGRLDPTDHVIDTASTRFAGVQALAVATAGDHAFVIAGGADHGITLFALLPDGRLLWLETFADTAQTGLHNVSALAATVSGQTLHIFAGSQRDPGLTHFTVALDGLGQRLAGTAGAASLIQGGAGHDVLSAVSDGDTLSGGAGNDILIAGPGVTHMRGGAGADVFVMRAGSGPTHILDFQRGIDRLDLSDWPMLRDLAQLTVIATATGARIEYRGQVVHITAADNAPLGANDLFPGGLLGPDRIPILLDGREAAADDPVQPPPPQPAEPPPVATQPPPEPRLIQGTAGNDLLHGGDGDDTIWGGHGNDLIYGTAGDNLIGGGPGDDIVHGGPGNDTIWGGPGDDLLYGHGGDNLIRGGVGNDTLWGGPGNDTLLGQAGNDVIHGVAGNNDLQGGPGADTIWGGTGDDTIAGGDGADLIHAGGGNNVIWGGRGRDTIFGGDGNDTIYGQDGPDQIFGGAGDDLLFGGAGNDIIDGGPGNDTINGGSGNDRLTGGPGADTFIFFRNHDRNVITDFNPDEGDMLHLFTGLWRHAANMTPQGVIDSFGRAEPNGNYVLDFGAHGGTIVVLNGFSDLPALAESIVFI